MSVGRPLPDADADADAALADAPERPSRRFVRSEAATSPQPLAGLSIILPCLDEEESVGHAIARAREVARRVAEQYEIIVVDDGSQDATTVIAAAEPGVRVIRHPLHRGYGAALRSGLGAARMPYVFVADADLQFNLDQIDRFLPALASADVVVGRRAHHSGSWAQRLRWWRWTRMARGMFALSVHDPGCGLKLMRREAVGDLELSSSGAAVSPELLVRCHRAGVRVAEVPVSQGPRRAGARRHPRLTGARGTLRELRALREALRAPAAERP